MTLTPTLIFEFDAERRKREARRIPISGANIRDISDAMKAVDLLTKLYLTAVAATIDPVAENLPVGHGIGVEEFTDLVTDLAADYLTGPLASAHSAKEEE